MIRKALGPLCSAQSAQRSTGSTAVPGRLPHAVLYFSAWAEDGAMLTQDEYCHAGSLADAEVKTAES